jgi:amino acid permease
METYGEVVRFCFGPGAELAVECILATFLLFVTTAYMILMRDINTSLMEFFFPSEEPYDGAKVLLVTLIFCFPCMLLKSLHSLRYNCYVGFASGEFESLGRGTI